MVANAELPGCVRGGEVEEMRLQRAWPASSPPTPISPSAPCDVAQLEEEWKPRHLQPRCGHIPGNSL